jgi:hypothetical protein
MKIKPRAMTRAQREMRAARRRKLREQNPAGSKLLKQFHASRMRPRYSQYPQNPCYGRRSERNNFYVES